MNNFIIINRTFATITPESDEIGDFDQTGFISEQEQVTFSELVNLMKSHTSPSCSPNNYDVQTWYGTGFFTSDYATGEEREECIHYSDKNTSNAAKYWKWAAIAAAK